MKVGIDARMLAHSGIGTYVAGLLRGFARDPGPHRYVVWTHPTLQDRVPRSNAFEVRTTRVPALGFEEHTRWPFELRRGGCDLIHVPHYNLPLGFDRPHVVTVHDLIPLLYPEPHAPGWKRAAAGLLLRNAVRRAARVVTASTSTRDDIGRILHVPDARLQLVYLGVDRRYRPLPQVAVAAFRRREALPARYILWIGLRRPHKNVERLVRGYGAWRARARQVPPHLVLWGTPSGRDPGVEAAIEELGLQEFVHPMARHLPADDMPFLYNAADAFVLPSLDEGFGLPPLEAAACGVPVLAARAGALPEILGDAAHFVNPLEIDDLARGLERIVEDTALRTQLVARGGEQAARYRWDRTAAAMRLIYEEALP